MSKSEIDTSAAEADIIKEKAAALEAELEKYKKAEEERLAAEEEAKKNELHKRLETLEKEKAAMQESFEKKLDEISLRASTAAKPAEESAGLTKEEYEKDKVKYDTMYLKASMPDVFAQ